MLKKILTSPITHFNLLIVGLLIFVGLIHNEYHHSMEHDAHGFVRRYCEKSDLCEFQD